MTTTEERLEALARRRTRPVVPSAGAPEGIDHATAPSSGTTAPNAPARRARRKAVAPLTRIITTGASLSAVLAGAALLALADRASSAPSSLKGVTTAASGGVVVSMPPAPPITVIVVMRQTPSTANTTRAAAPPIARAPSAASPLGARAPKPAVIAHPKAATTAPVTRTKKS